MDIYIFIIKTIQTVQKTYTPLNNESSLILNGCINKMKLPKLCILFQSFSYVFTLLLALLLLKKKCHNFTENVLIYQGFNLHWRQFLRHKFGTNGVKRAFLSNILQKYLNLPEFFFLQKLLFSHLPKIAYRKFIS